MTTLLQCAFVVLALIGSQWPSAAFAQEAPASSEPARAPGWLAKSLATSVAMLARTTPAQTSAQTGTIRSWPARHPILMATLIGAGAGVAFDVSACNLGRGGSGCLFWLIGPGVGALTGLIIDQAADSTGLQSGTVAVERAVSRLGVGRRIVVTDVNARRISGAIQTIDQDRFSVIPDGETTPVEIPFSDVRAVKKPVSRSLKIAIAAGVGAAALTAYAWPR